MILREATIKDSEQIALLHAQSWQVHYRGILREEYLNNMVQEDRLQLWHNRLLHPKPNQYVLVAEEKPVICGLACLYANYDPVWGSLLDNLHVLPPYKGRGIGRRLLLSAAAWSYHQNPVMPLHLWVYVKNESARGFYASLGGVHEETQQVENPGGGNAEVCLYIWRDVATLLNRQ
jgi:GNAT superfamily N-acetyltransferase